MLNTSFTVCVESWPHNVMKSIFTMLILFSQYILPIIVLPWFYYNVTPNTIIMISNDNSTLSSQMLKFLQQNQQSQEIERKKLKKLTLILTCLAVVFAVRSYNEFSHSKFLKKRQKTNC